MPEFHSGLHDKRDDAGERVIEAETAEGIAVGAISVDRGFRICYARRAEVVDRAARRGHFGSDYIDRRPTCIHARLRRGCQPRRALGANRIGKSRRLVQAAHGRV